MGRPAGRVGCRRCREVRSRKIGFWPNDNIKFRQVPRYPHFPGVFGRIGWLLATVVIFTTSAAAQMLLLFWRFDHASVAEYLADSGWTDVFLFFKAISKDCFSRSSSQLLVRSEVRTQQAVHGLVRKVLWLKMRKSLLINERNFSTWPNHQAGDGHQTGHRPV